MAKSCDFWLIHGHEAEGVIGSEGGNLVGRDGNHIDTCLHIHAPLSGC